METKHKPTIRRRGDPATCQKIWDAIKHNRDEKKTATTENIIRFVNKNYNLAGKNVERELNHLVLDGLIVENKTVATKSSKKGAEQTVYSIPENHEKNVKHDWYCFKCHKAGEVILCEKCPRVYHIYCVSPKETSKENFVCQACLDCGVNETSCLEQSEVNALLSFVVARLEDNYPMDFYVWNPSLTNAIYASSFSTDRCASLAQKKQKVKTSPGETDSWRAKYLLHFEVDLLKMNSRADRQVYKNFSQFRLDAQTLVHNVSIFHGEHSPTADTARMLLRKCLRELDEVKLCNDCYRRSNLQESPDWFCKPCQPPHELVFAKAKGYPYWPAKVMSIVDGKYDVRFFGGAHDRSKIDKSYIRPIDANINELVTKRTKQWVEAMEELERHQRMVVEDVSSDDDEDLYVPEEPSQMEVEPSTSKEVPPCEKNTATRSCARLSKTLRVKMTRMEEDPAVKSYSSSTQKELAQEDPASNSFDCLLGANCSSDRSETSAFADQVSLDQVLQQFKDDELSSAIEAVNHMKKEMEIMKEAHSIEIKNLKDEIERIAAERDKAVADAQDQAQQIAFMKQEYEEQIKTTERRFEEELVKVKQEQKDQMVSVEKDYEQKIEKMSSERHEKLQSIEEKHQLRINIMESEGKKLVEMKVDEVRAECEKKIEKTKKECQEQIEITETRHKEQLETIEKEGKEMISRKVEEVKEEYTKQLQTMKESHEEYIRQIREDCQNEILANKKKQWCAKCGNEGLYHCCLSVFYCSTPCQHEHWNISHKKICLRKKEKQEQRREISS